ALPRAARYRRRSPWFALVVSAPGRPWPVGWAVLACAVWLLAGMPVAAEDPALSDLNDLFAQLERNPIGPGEELRITKLVESHEMSGMLVQVRGSMPPHFHKRTQEIVHLIRGEGMFQLGADRIPIKAGAVLRIPSGTVHTFTNTGPEPAVFFVVTTPSWDEQDRFVVKD
ncbi:MAG TPA: cupin domain-containing protein, partial [Nitrospirales bacterium]|nr:cupin domain-containing protein [Nitrospirales bacterium]